MALTNTTAASDVKADPNDLNSLYKHLRVADVADALDGIGYFDITLMSPEIHPLWTGMKFWGQAATIRAVPANKPMWKLDSTQDIVEAHRIWFEKMGHKKLPADLAPGHVIVMDSSPPSSTTAHRNGQDADMTETTPAAAIPGAPTIDAHHHYWKVALQEQSWRTPAHEHIARDYEPHDLAEELARSGVDATVLVQSVDSSAENDRLAAYAESTTSVAGVVGWLPLATPSDAWRELERATTSRWSGVRCLVGRQPLDWLADPDVIALFRNLAERGLAWDVVPVTPDQVAAVGSLAEALPDLRIVVDHLARPPVDTGGWQPWAGQVAALAALPAVSMKLSVGIDVLTAWNSWRPPELAPYVDWALGRFGPQRVMLASNWPVVLLRGSYAQVWGDLTDLVRARDLSADELQDVMGGTAVRAYGLQPV